MNVSFRGLLTRSRRAACGQMPTTAPAGQPISVRDNPWPSGGFQPLTWVRMWGSGPVAEQTVGRSIFYVEGDNPSVRALSIWLTTMRYQCSAIS